MTLNSEEIKAVAIAISQSVSQSVCQSVENCLLSSRTSCGSFVKQKFFKSHINFVEGFFVVDLKTFFG